MMEQSAKFEIPAQRPFLLGVSAFIREFSRQRGYSEANAEIFASSINALTDFFLQNRRIDHEIPPFLIEIAEGSGKISLKIHYRGIPLSAEYARNLENFLEKHAVSAKSIAKIDFSYQGREGQSVRIEFNSGETSIGKLSDSETLISHEVQIFDSFEIVKLEENDAAEISRLFYRVYTYDYIQEFVYFPHELQKMLRDGRLISFAARLPEGRLLGHVGLISKNEDSSVWEPCLGVTDPQASARGMFSQIFDATMQHAATLKARYFFFDFVTNHIYSQKLISAYGCIDTALMLGCQSARTQARLSRLGLGDEPANTDRFSILYGIIPAKDKAFGEEIILPENIGKLLGFLIEPLGLSWVPASRYDAPAQQGAYEFSRKPEQEAVYFDCHEPGIEAVQGIIRDWDHLKKENYVYAAVDLPIEPPGLARLFELLASRDFFVAGIVPHANTEKLALRMQAIGPKKLDFSEIRLFGANAQRLLQIIRQQHERISSNV